MSNTDGQGGTCRDTAPCTLPRDCGAEAAPRRGRPPQLDHDTRLARILDATEDVLAGPDTGGVSMAAIARAAGMSKRTVYEHFPAREILIGACMRRLFDGVFSPLPESARALPLPDRLRLILTPDWERKRATRSLDILRTVIAETRRQPELAGHVLENGFSDLVDRLEAELSASVAAGEIALDDVPLAAAILRDMAFENPVTALLDQSACSIDRAPEYDRRRDRAIEIFCKGIA
ncbi:TetR/AcrR family transcriptional regulator [Acidimangrovimonas sediminis]|uniref:TetR/AcrR family transcriptional regulator n=1 Tax=Acidimangrovimonas sediminis TaxID=2056283 RepID=UPI000C8017B4|nr:TetR/AcrR family transcriptional regulator [Acidimangrovimonas sediminis]